LDKMDIHELESIVGGVLGRVTIATVLVLAMLGTIAPTASAVAILNQDFLRTWQRTDKPVADLVVSRTWMWGTEPFTAAGPEEYAEVPGGIREVQYFDKSRMEINHNPSVPDDSPWKVTNGLLVRELMTGQMQVGDNTFKMREPARVNVAGDPDDASNVTYWFMGLLQDEAPLAEGTVVNQILTPGAAGNLYLWSSELAGYGITAARYVPETNHTVAGPFWEFMNSWGTVYEDGIYRDAPLFENPFYATGYPLTEPYWANVKVAGTVQPVLIQCFERRCLTYTPNNDPAWRVEAGNVGQHYFRWRYGSGDAPPDDPAPVYDHIPGLDVASAIRYLTTIGQCEEPTATLFYIFILCSPYLYPDSEYHVTIEASESTGVVWVIDVIVCDPSCRSSSESPIISEVAAYVLGWVAQIPYAGASPSAASELVRTHINESGAFDVAGVRFSLNPPGRMEPDWASTSFWGSSRVLVISPARPES